MDLSDSADVFDIVNVTLMSFAVQYICGMRAFWGRKNMTFAEKPWPLLAVRMCLIETIDDVNEIIWFSSGALRGSLLGGKGRIV